MKRATCGDPHRCRAGAEPRWRSADPVRARTSSGRAPPTARPITLDGVLSEPAWAPAESMIVALRPRHRQRHPRQRLRSSKAACCRRTRRTPRSSSSSSATSSTWRAVVRDSSVGGSATFNRFDGLLMALKDHAEPRPSGAAGRVLLLLVVSGHRSHRSAGARASSPAFGGRWGNRPAGTPAIAEQIAAWDAVTRGARAQQQRRDRPTPGYTVEMRFDLGVMGYDVTQPDGDIVEWNISIYDCDWFWPLDVGALRARTAPGGRARGATPCGTTRCASTRSPSVTIHSGPLPDGRRPKSRIRNGAQLRRRR